MLLQLFGDWSVRCQKRRFHSIQVPSFLYSFTEVQSLYHKVTPLRKHDEIFNAIFGFPLLSLLYTPRSKQSYFILFSGKTNFRWWEVKAIQNDFNVSHGGSGYLYQLFWRVHIILDSNSHRHNENGLCSKHKRAACRWLPQCTDSRNRKTHEEKYNRGLNCIIVIRDDEVRNSDPVDPQSFENGVAGGQTRS